MALRHRLADASYWFYDRWRHKNAFEAAEQPCTATDFSGCEGKKYAVLVTYRKDGNRRAHAGLVRPRGLPLRRQHGGAHREGQANPPQPARVPSDPRGKPLGPGAEGTARILETEPERERAEAALDRHYGRTRRIYEGVMTKPSDMVYLEVTPGSPT